MRNVSETIRQGVDNNLEINPTLHYHHHHHHHHHDSLLKRNVFANRNVYNTKQLPRKLFSNNCMNVQQLSGKEFVSRLKRRMQFNHNEIGNKMSNGYEMSCMGSTISSHKSSIRKIVLELEDSLLLDLLILMIAVLTRTMMAITMDLNFLHLATILLPFDYLLVEDHMLSLYRHTTLGP